MAALSITHEEIATSFHGDTGTVEPNQLLHQPVVKLMGVSEDAAKALKKLGGIETVFDLATSVAFDAASKIVTAARDPSSAIFRYGKISTDLIRAQAVTAVTLVDMPAQNIKVLVAVPETQAGSITKSLNIETVRDMALYPPYQICRRILNYVYFPETMLSYDPERPADLIPKSGEYPIEKVQYSTLLMGEILAKPGVANPLTNIVGSEFQPIDLAALDKDSAGFKTVAMGALLTFTQSWFAQAVTLGHLLHSATLAPGESTRIAVIDWSRRSAAGETETITEADKLASDADHSRAISEVTNAVANEAQSGFSHSNTNSTTNSSGSTGSLDISSPLGGLFGGANASGATTSSNSNTNATSDGWSTTTGHRDVASSMLQNVNDRTHQNASSSRNRRASVVKEVSQNEHEAVSTRVIANYNHMHALSIQYYEVVQIFRVENRLSKAEKVIFVPFQMPDFAQDSVVRRFRQTLQQTALNYDMYQSLASLDIIELAPEATSTFSAFGQPLGSLYKQALLTRSSLMAGTLKLSSLFATNATTVTPVTPARSSEAADPRPAATDAPSTGSSATPTLESSRVSAESLARASLSPAKFIKFQDAIPIISQANSYLWNKAKLTNLASMLNVSLLRSSSNALQLPTDCVVEGAMVTGTDLPLSVVLRTSLGPVTTFGGDRPGIALRDVQTISVIGSAQDKNIDVVVDLTLSRNNVIFPLEVCLICSQKAIADHSRLPQVTVFKGMGATLVVNVKAGAVDRNLRDHLNANRMHYGQAIFRSLDAVQIAQLLSGYGYQLGEKLVPVMQMVEPRPIRYVGNYLAFKTNISASAGSNTIIDPAWDTFIKDSKIEVNRVQSDIIPLGSGGVFAEAVLGRSNCAEVLDATRFWDWKDSPIPIQPSDIAAITTGSRATNEDTKPGQLSAPIINLQTPTSLPDPIGTASILAAIQNGNMFRDQSGLAATIGLTQAALQATQAGAATAGQQAGQSQANQLQATTERQKTAAAMITDLAKTAASVYTGGLAGGGGGGGSSTGVGGKTGSQQGALMNYFDKSQTMPTQNEGPSGVGGTIPVLSQGSSNGGGGPSAGGSGSAVTAPRGSGSQPTQSFSQNPAALAAVRPSSNFMDTLLSKVDGVLGLGSDTAGAAQALGARKAWPNLDPNLVLPRIEELHNTPSKFNQGGFGLCTVAAFFYVIIQTNPSEFASFAKALYGGGIGFLGKMKVNPDQDLRSADYAQIMLKLDKKYRPPPQADWMLMSSVRDSQNWFFDFEGDPGEDVAMSTALKEIAGWYKETGWYQEAVYNDNPTLDELRNLPGDEENVFICLSVKVQILEPDFSWTKGDEDGHILVLKSKMILDEVADTATFDYWTWAAQPKTLHTTVTSVKANLRRYLSARKA